MRGITKFFVGVIVLAQYGSAYMQRFNQAEAFRYYHDQVQQQQQQYQIQQGVDLPTPIPVNPPQFLYGNPSVPTVPMWGQPGGE